MQFYAAIDGPDGVGKTTVISKLSDLMDVSGVRNCVIREPGGTEFGEAMRQLLLTHPTVPQIHKLAQALLLASGTLANATTYKDCGILLSDRWAPLTSRVFQTSMAETAEEERMINSFWDYFVTNLVPQPRFGQPQRPDHLIYLLASPETLDRRKTARRQTHDNMDPHRSDLDRRRADMYVKLANSPTLLYGITPSIYYTDNCEPEQLAVSIFRGIQSSMSKEQLQAIGINRVEL